MVKGLCGVVILYHPEEQFFDNIKSYAASLERLWIIDNTDHHLQDYRAHFEGYGNVEIIQDGKNRGIGNRVNMAIKLGLMDGYEWLLTMDQDSFFTKQNLNEYQAIINGVNSRQKIALIGTMHHNEEKNPDPVISLQEDLTLITSGSCINLRAIADVGLMNEELFIDEVDSDFSYRAHLAGWQVFVCKGVYLKHSLGESITGRSIVTGELSNRSVHPPLRLYYITRNFLWVRRKYRRFFPGLFKIRARQQIHIYKNNLLYNKDRLQAVKMIWKGYLDFKRNKLGKLTE